MEREWGMEHNDIIKGLYKTYFLKIWREEENKWQPLCLKSKGKMVKINSNNKKQ